MNTLFFKNKLGLLLAGSLWPAPSDSILIMVHGVTGNASANGLFDQLAPRLQAAHYNVLTFDLAGHGKSENAIFSLQQCADDVTAAIAFCKEQGFKHIVLLGHSAGGYGCLKGFEPSVATVITLGAVSGPMRFEWNNICTPQQIARIQQDGYATVQMNAQCHLTKLSTQYLEEVATIDQALLAQSITCPVLLIHGTAHDYEARFQQESKKLLPLLPDGSKITIIPGTSHSFLEDIPAVAKEITEWLKEHAPVKH